MSDRLTKSDWIDQGLRTLADEGPHGLKVGAMAEKLSVSRGSFYWHFRDIADFRAQLLQGWRERATDHVIRQMEAEEAGPDRLKRLMKRAFGTAPRLDWAIRAWAADDTNVAVMVASVDTRRIDYIAGLLVAAGIARPRALHRATFVYCAFLGQTMLPGSGDAPMTAYAMDDISGLFER